MLLAMAFSTIFVSDATGATVFNAPGFTDNETNQQFFLKLGGSIPAQGAAGATSSLRTLPTIGSRPRQALRLGIQNAGLTGADT